MSLPPPKRLIPLDKALDAMGIEPSNGQDVRVAIIGTGIDPAVQVAYRRNLTTEPNDVMGHETAIARIIGSVAPEAELYDIHALTRGEAKTSRVITALMHAKEEEAHICNLSLGSDDQATPDEPVSQVIDFFANEYDIISVVAGGNNGPGPGTIEAPGGAHHAIVVGSVNAAFQPSRFSARGPDATGRIRPDLTALGGDYDEALQVPTVGELAKAAGVRGTSFSTGFVTGYLASIYEQLPRPKVASARALLAMTEFRSNFKDNDYGYGVLDGRDRSKRLHLLHIAGATTLTPPY